MSYETVEAALKTQLETIAGLTVSLDDGTKIQGGRPKIAILKYDGFEQEVVAMGGYHVITWTILVELWCRYTNDAATRKLLRTTRMAMLDRINAYPKLGNTSGVFDSLLRFGEGIETEMRIGSVRYYREVLSCEIQEEVEVTYSG